MAYRGRSANARRAAARSDRDAGPLRRVCGRRSRSPPAACSLPGQPRVINLEPTCLDDVFECLRLVGDATDRARRRRDEIAKLTAASPQWPPVRSDRNRPRVVVLEWIDPPFSSGHWSPELVRLAGGEEVVGVAGERSRTLDWQQIVDAAPEVHAHRLLRLRRRAHTRRFADPPQLSRLERVALRPLGACLRRRRLGLFQPPWPAARRLAGNPRPRARSRRFTRFPPAFRPLGERLTAPIIARSQWEADMTSGA